MPDATPTLTLQTTPAGRCALLGGSWSAARLAEPAAWRRIQQALASLPTAAPNRHPMPSVAIQTDVAPALRPHHLGEGEGISPRPSCDGKAAGDGVPALSWDLRALTRLDHTGAQLLWNSWGRQWPADVQLSDGQRTMLERVAQFTAPDVVPARPSWWQLFLKLGANLWLMWDHVLGVLTLAGQLLLDLVTLLRSPKRGPWRDVSGHLYRIGATALPVTALVGFMIGIVLAYLMSRQLRQFGADSFIVDILGIAIIRELGPMLAAILIAGRSGSAITAQIGVMRVTEELDAMRVMGIAQGYRLVLPRAMALGLAMPLISVWTTLAALLGGMLAADAVLGVTPAFFFATLPDAVDIGNLWLAVGKSVVFGLLIALIGCHYGLRIKPNTESLGRGTTASVVTSITVVLLVDAACAVIFKNVGM